MRVELLWLYDKKNKCDEMHPAEELRGEKNNKLLHKRIVLGITGSISAVESVQLARELIRHGATLYPVMTPAATRIVHPDALEFATSHKPVIQLTGKTEHVYWCGLVQDPVDLLLISPCTANTISKIAHGIDDTAVTTFATTAIGSRIPIILVPAMHLSMYNHKIVQKNIDICKAQGILFIDPHISGTKAKLPKTDEIVETAIRVIGKRDLLDKKILIIGGATAEPIDDIRLLTNRSSGKTAISLCVNAFERGANIELWYGYATELVPSYIHYKRFKTVTDLLKLIDNKSVKHFNSIILCAAIANYIPKKQKGKIPSGKEQLCIECVQAKNIIKILRSQVTHAKIIAFKTEEKKINVKIKTKQLLEKHKLNGVVGNTLAGFDAKENEIYIYMKNGKNTWKKGKKEELASFILDMIK